MERENAQNANESEQLASLRLKGFLQKHGWLFFLAAITLLIALFAFGSSPFYPINEWTDPNCFMTVGRSMLQGKVVYRDIYEQKGPYVYFLHALCALVSDTSFLGVFFAELVCLFFVLFFICKIVALYGYQRPLGLFIATLVGVSACFSYAMSLGDSVEEFSAPLYLWLLYITLKRTKEQADFKWFDHLLIGVTSGVIFWSKFSLVGIYLGWFAFFIWRCIRRKTYADIWKSILLIVGGVAISTLPCLFYFWAKGALTDWLKVYLYDNLFLYSAEKNPFFAVLKMLLNILYTLVRNPQYGVFAVVGVVWFAIKNKGEERFLLLLTFAGMAFFQFVGGRGYRYYGLPFYVFAPFGFLALSKLLENRLQLLLKRFGALVCVLFVGVSVGNFFMNGHQHDIFHEKSDMAQYKVAQYIREHGDEDPTLLQYGGLDGGFYLAAEEIPEFKYFCKLNVDLPEMDEEMQRYLDEGKADFVVVKIWEEFPEPWSHENYEEVLRIEDWARNERATYLLFQRKS